MTRWKRTAASVTALAAIGTAGIAAAPAAFAAGPAKSWGPFTDSAAVKKAISLCRSVGNDGVEAKKWRSYTCEVEAGKVGDYVSLYVKI
ncbi:hypothetical protein [Streptomyces sp. NRRL F-5135]|uniref:hypothetical protein n=1 Tax=Streptomyces sp. NRRL F-5135 TaxID=1463858 RepID=UPI0004C9F8B4|nr:hypothetical protein [Streptomyces sp. NRRL F-5135]